MPLKGTNSADNKSKGATTNPNPTKPDLPQESGAKTATTSGVEKTAPPVTATTGAPAEPIAGKAPKEGGSDQNSTVNEANANTETAGNRAHPDLQLDAAKTPPTHTDTSKRPEALDRKDTFDPSATPGFHVMAGGKHLGTYNTEEDAQAFIDGHLKDQNISAKIEQGSTSSHDPATEGSDSPNV
jgi:hypothetical protein